IVFAVSMVRSYFPPERARQLLVQKREYTGNGLAAALGIVTPFCSCSAVPLFIGFVESGIPLGVTFSFLVSSPMVNEVALALLWGLFGVRIALLYIGSGLLIAIVAGIVIGRLRLERFVEDYVWEIKTGRSPEILSPSFRQRLFDSAEYSREILKRVGLFVLLGVGVGAFIHGYAPEGLLAQYAGKENPFGVLVAVLIGIPLYANAAGTIPIVQSLIEKGLPLGTALAFMMAVTALSFPEMVILRKVLKPRLLAVFIGVVGAGIVFTGYLFNWVL
ncbi:MAG TPA: permease, partial [bacterium]|nr:permease [bacterium]